MLVILSHNCFCFFHRRSTPLNLKIFISSDAFDNSSFFDEQPKFTWLVCVAIAVKVRSEIDAASRYPISLHDTLIRGTFSVRPLCNAHERIGHFSFLCDKGGWQQLYP